MIRLQHEFRRGGPGEIELVNGVRYELDADGCIEVTPEAADKLLAGERWRDPSHWAGMRSKAPVSAPEITLGARRPRTRSELEALAQSEGIAIQTPTEPTPDPVSAAEPEAATESETETIEVGPDMTKAQLLRIAKEAGYVVKPAMSKAQILATFENGGA